MEAAVLDGPAQPFDVREVDLDEPRAGEALVRIAASGLRGSDLKALDGLRSLAPFPLILGHEAAGVVEHVGEGVQVAVFGCGGVGLSAIQGARIAGAETIVAVDVQPEKLALALAVGATDTVDASAERGPAAAVREATDGGVDYAFEAAGRSEAIEQAWASLAIGGLLTAKSWSSHREEWHVN
jgi:Zn-dependent alcohol dehydrogenase